MKRILLTTSLFIALFVIGSSVAYAQSSTGNPVGSLESISCSSASGWSYDPDFSQPPVSGCTNSSATNYNPNAAVDDGSCVIPPQSCVSRYRWVNTGGGVNQAQGCANAGAAPVASSFRGICVSGEDRPSSGYDVNSIYYRHGTWGGGNGGGGSIVRSSRDDWRCYQGGQNMDEDGTDIAVAYYCDFGTAFPESCPADNPPAPAPGGTPGEPSGGSNEKIQLNFNPKSFFDALASLFKPLTALAGSSDSNSVEVYEGGINGTLIATIPANIYRGDVNAVMGISGNHGFSWGIPQSLIDGASHTLYFYGTNTDGAGQTSQLGNSPATIQCAPAVAGNSAPSSPSLVCPSNGSSINTPLQVSFTASDSNGNGVRYLVDWDANGSTDQIVPAGGAFAPSGSQQSASRSWSTPGSKTVRVTAEDDQGAPSGAASCSFTLTAAPPPATASCADGIDNDGDGKTDFPADPGCTDASDTDEADIVVSPVDICVTNPADPSCNTGGGGGGGTPGTSGFCLSNPADPSCVPGSSFCLANPSAPSCALGFTVTSDEGNVAIIQFLGTSAATSTPRRMEVNPVSGFTDPVSLQVVGIQSRAAGAPLPAGTSVSYSFDDADSTATLTWNSSFGRYVTSQGIGSVFKAGFSKAIPEPYNVTIRGTDVNNPAVTSDYVLTIDPSNINPQFIEI